MKYNFQEMQNKKPFEIMLHVERVTSLQSWMAKKSCLGQTLINECSTGISDYPSTFEGLQLALHAILFDKKSRQTAIEIEISFFHSLRNPKGRTLDHFFYALHIRHNVPYKLIRISMS